MPRAHVSLAAVLVLATLAAFPSSPASAQGTRSTTQAVADEIFGYALMTDRERDQYRERLRKLDDQGRERFEADHREQMRRRAKDRGIDLDEDGPGRGSGQGKGEPRGPGPGPGERVGPYGEPPGQQRKPDDGGWNSDDDRDDKGTPKPKGKPPGQPGGQNQGGRKD
jgi:hypothetical protein